MGSMGVWASGRPGLACSSIFIGPVTLAKIPGLAEICLFVSKAVVM